jgi:hypothetical protein
MRYPTQIRRLRFASQIGIFLFSLTGIVHAEPHPLPADVHETDVARKRFMEGVASLKSGNYEEARISFQQSYALKPSPAGLRNLAATELKTGRYLDAARHFTTYLKTTKPSEIDRPDAIQQGLAEAKSHCGMLVVETSVPGALIVVDGETVGKTPLDSDPWLVEPGDHVVTARLEGYDDHRERHHVDVGRTLRISIALQPSGSRARAGIATEATAPRPAERLASSTAERTFDPGAEARVMQPLPLPHDNTSRVSVAPIAIGGAIAIAGLAFGIGYSAASDASARDHDALLDLVPGPSPKCGNRTPNAELCGDAQELAEKADSQRNLATAGFVVAGVAGAATLAYWLWPRSSRSQGVLVPTVAPAYAGIQWRSSF